MRRARLVMLRWLMISLVSSLQKKKKKKKKKKKISYQGGDKNFSQCTSGRCFERSLHLVSRIHRKTIIATLSTVTSIDVI
jgi:Tfp pilus assembly protein PilV